MITVSQPDGMTPPVMMRTACPGAAAPWNGLPAKDVPTTFSVVSPVEARSAKRNCITVHRRVVVGGHVHGGADVLGQHAAERCANIQAFYRGDRSQKCADVLSSLVHWHRVRVVIVRTG